MGNKISGCFTAIPRGGTSELGPDSKTISQPNEFPTGTIYEYTVKDVKGKDVNLSMYRGKVLVIVNVASQCGLTDENYTEFNQLYQKYKDKGLEILAFPCNQFAAQEPGSNEQIQEFACTRFKTAFPIFNKIEVNGFNTAPLYKFLKLGKWGFFDDDIQWNFAKFLVDKQGKPVVIIGYWKPHEYCEMQRRYPEGAPRQIH
ncbi:probable phospholipid hydroperoxide glutathione peroxidase [Malus sylvestris]|uniref:probable phospholipid hydroperoxide glutathione peroxidase n=1 Tax=Malus sylvestris TaxID=3752 RepID=UPI0021ACFD65|nr:probable phospholipid hydroperoxide glutathione peroxidase [Malus sylvestris]